MTIAATNAAGAAGVGELGALGRPGREDVGLDAVPAQRLRRGLQWTIAIAAIVHSWVLTVFREPVLKSWQMFFAEGPHLPWYRVLSLTSDPGNPWLGTWWVPSIILLGTAIVAWTVWRVGARMETAHVTR